MRRGVAAYALEPADAERLWQVSLDLVGGSDDDGGSPATPQA